MNDKCRARGIAAELRRCQPDKDAASALVIDRLFQLDRYRNARRVAWYVDVRDEVRTRDGIRRAIDSGQQVSVPYCVDDGLRLVRIRDFGDLSLGAFGILEPRVTLRERQDLRVEPESLDAVIVPGVGFDSGCRRVGHGGGYYDRLLSRTHPGATLIGLCYETQILPLIPVEPHDRLMDVVVTSSRTFIRRS